MHHKNVRDPLDSPFGTSLFCTSIEGQPQQSFIVGLMWPGKSPSVCVISLRLAIILWAILAKPLLGGVAIDWPKFLFRVSHEQGRDTQKLTPDATVVTMAATVAAC